MLTASELADIRNTAAEFLPDSAILKRRTLTSDGNGGQAETYTTVGTYPCRLVFKGGQGQPQATDGEEAGSVQADATYLVTLKYNVAIEETDRLEINGNTYAIITPATARSWEVTKRLLVTRI